jgi:adenosylmethionine---8-amino-7-oxononanoate aminotransferase
MLNKGFFITGTDTGVGKTVVSALLMSCLKDHLSVRYFKPLQTGANEDDDTLTVVQLAGLNSQQIYPPVYRFQAPLSPDRAAALEGREVSLQKIINSFDEALGHRNEKEGLGASDFFIVEGAGGLEVPISTKEKISDLVRELRLPTILVASTRLGTINHTLLTVKRMQTLGLPLMGVILVGNEDRGLRELFQREGVRILFEIPHYEQLAEEWEYLRQAFAKKILDITRESLQSTSNALTAYDHSLAELDQKIIWHPYTQHGAKNYSSRSLPQVKSGSGAEITLAGGEVLIDAISSWWVNLHGHSHPKIAEAIALQAKKLEHVIFAGFTHEPAIVLAQQLLREVQKLAPKIERVFYSDNGSTAVEVALKMAYQAQQQKGQTSRTKFLALHGSYHGDTLAAMSASDRNGFHKIFTPLMAPVDFIEPDNFPELENLAKSFDTYAACIVEPLVQGAGAMRMYSPRYLQRLAELCREYGVYLIADEVFTGFYRTGTFLACEQANVKPDLICLSKGITGGFLPLSVTLATGEIFSAFESESIDQAFLHGHSYTANPIACAAGIASLEILLSPDCQERIGNICQWTREQLQVLAAEESGRLVKSRQLGTIGAIDLAEKTSYFSGKFSARFAEECRKRGVLLRPLGGTIYTLPPYCVSEKQFKKIYEVIQMVLKNGVNND